ncbi:MAG: hypothetical protein M3Q44_00765 [bacterium]|nr:hypothetical protein [bacterium]
MSHKLTLIDPELGEIELVSEDAPQEEIDRIDADMLKRIREVHPNFKDE